MLYDVVIAGAGPNGLMLACELRLAGVRPIVLERLPERSTEPRANGLVGQVVRMLDRRGLYEALAGQAGPPEPVADYVFGALPLRLEVLEENPLYLLGVPQIRIEEVLQDRALELGVEIRRGHELTGLSQSSEAVTARISGPDGGYELQSRYFVGADGGRSLTRKLVGIDFPGVTQDKMVSRSAGVAVPEGWIDPATLALTVPGYGTIPAFRHHRTERGLFVFAPFPGRAPVVSTGDWDLPPDGPVTFAEVRESAERVLGVELPISPALGDGPQLLRRIVGGNSRLADRFREGRVLLVGDAAHVHSAIGGPGLNLGLQDAINLGWKLAAEIQGWAPPGLLDSYELERRPVGNRVVMHTQAQSALIAPGSEVTALRELMAELLQTPRNVQHIADLMSGADIQYFKGTHPLVGRWAPDLLLDRADGRPTRLADLTQTARPLLLDFSPDSTFATELADATAGELAAEFADATAGDLATEFADAAAGDLADVSGGDLAVGFADKSAGDVADASAPASASNAAAFIHTLAGGRSQVEIVAGSTETAGAPVAMLLRPDGYVAWAADGVGESEREGLRAAVGRWFGVPAQRPLTIATR